MTRRKVAPETAALLDLVETLSAFGRDDGLTGSDWFEATVAEFMTTPGLQNLDPLMFDALLTWAGFDLTDAASLSTAARLTAILLGANALFIGAADEGHLVRELAESDDLEDCRQVGVQFFESDEATEYHQIRTARCLKYIREYYAEDTQDEGPDDFPYAA